MGYRRLITYTQDGESGVSLRAAGFRPAAHLPPHQGWDRPSRHRPHRTQPTGRTRWEVTLGRPTECHSAPRPRQARPHCQSRTKHIIHDIQHLYM
ncbi:XF1762 family protein [Streptomyces boetiae]|uniref:XF1762 family protein n=1 Tax=Streptomyces boetiae TaxID=3075541 RepID=UPI00374E087D